MDLMDENELTGLQEVRGKWLKTIDESRVTLVMRLIDADGNEDTFHLPPGTYRQLAYAETMSPDMKHAKWRLLEVPTDGVGRDHYLATSWRLTEFDRNYLDFSPALLSSILTNTPPDDELDPTILHAGDAHRLTAAAAARWLRIYKRPVPLHLDPCGLGKPLTNPSAPRLYGVSEGDGESGWVTTQVEGDPDSWSYHTPDSVMSDMPISRIQASTTLRMEMGGFRFDLPPGKYRILGMATSRLDCDECEEILLDVNGDYLIATQHTDLEVIGMTFPGGEYEASSQPPRGREDLGSARMIEPKAAAEWLDRHGKTVPTKLVTHLLGENLADTLAKQKDKSRSPKPNNPGKKMAPKNFVAKVRYALAGGEMLTRDELAAETGRGEGTCGKYLSWMTADGTLDNKRNGEGYSWAKKTM